MKTMKYSYAVALPVLTAGTQSFKVKAQTKEGAFALEFRWNFVTSIWTIFATMPDGSERQAGVFPNCMSWTGCADFGYYVSFNGTAIGLDDLALTQHYIVVWA